MRQITKEACQSFENGTDYKKSNTEVKNDKYYLHSNLIAEKRAGALWITLAGWNSNTTRERLNGLQGVSVTTKQGQAYLNGKEWNGEWITIKR